MNDDESFVFFLFRNTGKAEEQERKKFMEKKNESPAAFKIDGACRYLCLSRPSLYRLVARGLLKANRSTRHYIFLRSELDRFLRDGMS